MEFRDVVLKLREPYPPVIGDEEGEEESEEGEDVEEPREEVVVEVDNVAKGDVEAEEAHHAGPSKEENDEQQDERSVPLELGETLWREVVPGYFVFSLLHLWLYNLAKLFFDNLPFGGEGQLCEASDLYDTDDSV